MVGEVVGILKFYCSEKIVKNYIFSIFVKLYLTKDFYTDKIFFQNQYTYVIEVYSYNLEYIKYLKHVF